jgi:ribosomal protein S19
MTRSAWKGPYSKVLLDRETETRRVWSRSSMIVPNHLGDRFLVHNGKSFVPVKVVGDMIGHKFGEFASTRKKPIHKSNKKRQVNRRKTPS